MAFTSLTFVLLVLATVALYYLLPRRFQWLLLLAASMVFYLSGGGRTVIWLLAVAAVTWGCGLALQRLNDQRKGADKARQNQLKAAKKRVVALGAVLCFGLLYAMKYWNFTLELLPTPVAARLPRWDFLMPLGLSFFTFQAVGYVVDVYRGKAAQNNPVKYLLFVSFFPQMIQGPIGRYDALAPQLLAPKELSWQNLQYGIQLAMWGYFKKLVIADRAAVLVDTVIRDNCPYGGAVIAVGILFYCVQLYCDFSGGIDIARGVAQMLGITMAENFRRPLFATSLADYWRRWHISLGQWMRDYLFYPLSLSKPFGRLGKWARRHIGGLGGKIFATSLATFIIYLVIGVWHGSSLKYIVYGLWNGTIITSSLLLERRFQSWKDALHIDGSSLGWRIVMTVRTCFLVFLGRYLTRAPRLLTAGSLLVATFTRPVFSQLTDGTLLSLGLTGGDFLLLGLAAAVLVAVEFYQERGGHVRETLARQRPLVQWLAIVVPLLVIVAFGVFRTGYISSAFIYGQF